MTAARPIRLGSVDLLTTPEVAESLRVSESTVRYWKHRGEGPRSMKVGRRVLYRREDVETWLAGKYDAAEACGLDEALTNPAPDDVLAISKATGVHPTNVALVLAALIADGEDAAARTVEP